MLKQERADIPGASYGVFGGNVIPVKTGIRDFSLDSRFCGNDAIEADGMSPEQSKTREDPISLVFHRNEKTR
jgi:hypothetical protein